MIGYNEAWVKSVSFEEFVEQMGSHPDATDLKTDWERITGKKVKPNQPEQHEEKDTYSEVGE